MQFPLVTRNGQVFPHAHLLRWNRLTYFPPQKIELGHFIVIFQYESIYEKIRYIYCKRKIETFRLTTYLFLLEIQF